MLTLPWNSENEELWKYRWDLVFSLTYRALYNTSKFHPNFNGPSMFSDRGSTQWIQNENLKPIGLGMLCLASKVLSPEPRPGKYQPARFSTFLICVEMK